MITTSKRAPLLLCLARGPERWSYELTVTRTLPLPLPLPLPNTLTLTLILTLEVVVDPLANPAVDYKALACELQGSLAPAQHPNPKPEHEPNAQSKARSTP